MTAREYARLVRDRIGDSLDGVYPEIPPERNAARRDNLRAGLDRYLAPDGSERRNA